MLVPNISAPVSTLRTALMDREGIRAGRLPVGGVEQIRVGKKYTHNDICFPCQMVIGELIDALQKGNYPEDSVAVGMAKLSCDCRMANYTAILRKALDSAGFENVPILTTDPGDTKGIHPGVSMLGARSVLLLSLIHISPAPAGPSLPATRSGRSFSAATGRSCAGRWMPRTGRFCGGTSASTPAPPPPSSSL